MRATLAAAATGVLAAGAAVSVALASAIPLGEPANPITSVGSLVIDLAPPAIKDTVIALFGTGDKPFLIAVLLVLLTGAAAVAGVLELMRRGTGMLLLAGVAAVAAGAVATRSGSSPTDLLPTILGAIAGAFVLRTGARRLRDWRSAAPGTSAAAVDRRKFLQLLGVAAAGAAILSVGSAAVRQLSNGIEAIRTTLGLPRPADPSPPIPDGADLDVPGITPYVTPNESFYRIDTALLVPNVDPADWTLRINGMVEREIELTFDELLAKPLVERALTLTCVSNVVGGDLVGNAVWLGYPVRELLAEAVPLAGADMVLSRSVDGFTAGTPLEALQDPDRLSLIAIGMNGEPLPLEHGFPVRMVVSGLYGYVSATKWLTELTVTRFADAEGYWTPRGWSARGPIKLASRIDTPRPGGTVPSPVVIAGVAWAQNTGIEKVEVRVDDGPWQTATLAGTVSADTWRQWSLEWDAQPGEHTLTVRATDADGTVQTSLEAPPAPDGASGHHSVTVQVRGG
ncbi:molybdopterin-dependent oxidoreductase [Lysobacter korlensis]|uniref:Molybdopterin-dependent oxidoreductase n=1 Tax=Lysobacter korlensis TaxID=553636 RepID=A0ABV6RVJ4_9GAMM